MGLSAGERIGNFVVVSPIAAGGMGVVYRARHCTLGSMVALKVLSAGHAMSEKVRQRFEQEARLQAQLTHSNIVTVRDLISGPDSLVIVMDLVEGPSLEDVISQELPGAWPLDRVMSVMIPVVGGLAFTHARDVVHRDMKPANVLLDRSSGGFGVPRITDFGIAKILGGSGAGMTRMGAMMGTPVYMAPEQFEGRIDIDARADVYAIGMMFWALAAGRLPADPANNRELLELYGGHTPVPHLSDVAPHVPRPVGDVIAHCLSHSPAQRPPNASVVLQMLQGHPQPSASTWAAPPPGRPTPAAATVFEAGPVALPAGPLAGPPTGAGTVADSRGGSGRAALIGAAAAVALMLAVGGAYFAGQHNSTPDDTVDRSAKAATTNAPAEEASAALDAPVAAPVSVDAPPVSGLNDEIAGAKPAEPPVGEPPTPSAAPEVQVVAPPPRVEPAPAPAEPAPAPDPCPNVSQWNGRWSMTTVVHGNKDSFLGVNGFYELSLQHIGGCRVRATMSKIGHGKSRISLYKSQKVQSGSTVFDSRAMPSNVAATRFEVDLRRPSGGTLQRAHFYLIHEGHRLTGHWHYGGDTWSANPLWGTLKAEKNDGTRVAHAIWETSQLPCWTQCVVQCRSPRTWMSESRGGTLPNGAQFYAGLACASRCNSNPNQDPPGCN